MNDLTAKALARKLSISERKARELIATGAVASYRVGRAVRVPATELARVRRGAAGQ